MDFSRREFAKLALSGLPAAAVLGSTGTAFAATAAQARPNSLINGVQIGTITYSYRSMPDQSAEATLKYVVDSGISAIELMGGPVTAYARAKTNYQPSTGGGGGRGGGGGQQPAGRGGRGGPDPATLTASWNGVPCAPAGAAGRAQAAAPAPAANAPAAAPQGGGGGGRGGQQTPEQIAAAAEERKWRQSIPMSVFTDLKKMYNDAGVTIYCVKNLSVNASEEDLEWQFIVARTLGANHITAELPAPSPTSQATLKRVGDVALRTKMYAAYHTHAQGSMTAFDEAFAASRGNMSNVDLGHLVAGGNKGGDPIAFLNRHHARISSFHLKDRTLPENCALNLAWGTGQTPIKEILQLVRRNKWQIPASIELEYAVPEGSNAVAEVAKCVAYCRQALA